MRDLGTVLWKEVSEFLGNARSLRLFGILVLAMGILPALEGRKMASAGLVTMNLLYVLFAAAMMVSQTAPDTVLRERNGRTLEYLLSTRLPDTAIFGGKIVLGMMVGYFSVVVTIVVQLLAINILGHTSGWTWAYLAQPQGRLLALLFTLIIGLYLATVGTFIALRVGDQRTASLLTLLTLVVFALPIVFHVVHPHLTMPWLWKALGVMAIFTALVVRVGFRLFRRELLVLAIQE